MMRNAPPIAVLLLALLGCGSHDAETSKAGAAAPAAARRAQDPADALSRSMVSAVAATKPGAAPLPVQVRFSLRSRPEIGQPLEVQLVIIPRTAVLERLSAKLEAEDGLELQGAAELPEALKPAEGTPIRHTVHLVPRHDGMYLLNAIVSADSGGQVATQMYSIPIIAGQGMSDLPLKPAVPAADASPAIGATAPQH